MKIISLLILLFSTQVFGGLEDKLSSQLETRLNTAFNDVSPGKYQISIQASYQYKLTPTDTIVTLPVFLSALRTYSVPEAFDSCQMDPASLNCLSTKSFVEWFETQAPANQGELVITTYMFENCQGYPCNFVKQATVAVSMRNI